jgi:hypothetical protein
MQLSPQDVNRLKKIGYSPADFSTRKEGFRTLRNVKGVCYFFDQKTRSCKVYAKRPEGCRYYPIVYSVDEGKPIIDEEVCRRVSTVTTEDLEKATPRLTKLARKLLVNQGS